MLRSTLQRRQGEERINIRRIWTIRKCGTENEIDSEVNQYKDKISFYHEEDSVSKIIDIPMNEIARIEYLFDPKHRLLDKKDK